MSRPTVLLTGASGFIGRRLQALLLGSGYPVKAMLRPGSERSHLVDPACTVVGAEFSERETLLNACGDVDAVVYCAGTVRGRTLDDFLPANVGGVSELARAINHLQARTPFLLISSLAAARPGVSDYAHSKHLGEQALMTEAQFPWSIFRPPAVYGPGDREMLPLLRNARRGLVLRPGPPAQRLSLLHVDDLARAVRAWLESWRRCENQCFTLDDGHPGGYDWKDIAEAAAPGRALQLGIPRQLLASLAQVNYTLSGILGYAPMLTPGKVRELTADDWLCDNSALTRTTGWEPTIDLAAGMRLLFDSA